MVSKKMFAIIAVLSVLLVLLSACGKAAPTEDPTAKITQVAATVQAELTQIALLTPSATTTPTITPTVITATPTLSTPMGTSTPTKGAAVNTGDNAKFDKDITIPDGSIIKPGASFDKTWSVMNNGTTTWNTNYQLMYLQGPQATVMSVNLPKNVEPGQTIQITIRFTAPATLGSYTGWWTLVNANGFSFGEQMSVVFTVGNETATPTSSTPSGSATATLDGTTTVTPSGTTTP